MRYGEFPAGLFARGMIGVYLNREVFVKPLLLFCEILGDLHNV